MKTDRHAVFDQVVIFKMPRSPATVFERPLCALRIRHDFKRLKQFGKYFFAIQKILKEKGDPFKVMIAFSGKKKVDGIE